MNESLERWGDSAPDFFRGAAVLYDHDRPSELEEARMLARVELSTFSAGQGAFTLAKLLAKVGSKIVLSVIAGSAFVVGAALLVTRPGAETARPRASEVPPPSPVERVDAVSGQSPVRLATPGSTGGQGLDRTAPSALPSPRNASVLVLDKKKPVVRIRAAPPDASAELALLVRARRILPADPLRAYLLTDQHRASYREGALREERELLAIEALTALARKDEALTRAAQFSERFPASVHARRLSQILQKTAP